MDCDDAQPITSDDYEDSSAFDPGPDFNPFARQEPPDGLMTLETAVSAPAAMKRNAQRVPGHAVSLRAQRALPRGRSG
jgi:hypothetical protein